jgi:hypothetical protein
VYTRRRKQNKEAVQNEEVVPTVPLVPSPLSLPPLTPETPTVPLVPNPLFTRCCSRVTVHSIINIGAI